MTLSVTDALLACARTVQRSRQAYDELDAAAGDGDFGGVLALAGRNVEQALTTASGSAREVLLAAAQAVADVGGTTGPIWGTGLLRLADALREEPASASSLAAGLHAAADGISELGGASVGDKTLLDALVPVADALEQGQDPVAAGRRGADGTSELVAARGRASYQGERSRGAPDAGAVAVADLVELVAGLVSGNAELPEAGGSDDATGPATSNPGGAGHLVDDPGELVDQALAGLALAHPDLVRVERSPRFAVRADAPVADKVALVSGGGSGHEPMHTGLIGPGLLDAACPGEVFASPSAAQVAAAIRAADAGRGVLLIVKNYTGDVLNFRLGAQLAEADGIRTETVLVADDIAVDGSAATIGRRGVAGTVVLEKIAGAAAADGLDLDAVAALARRVADGLVSMGTALSGVTLPAGGDPAIDLATGEMEVGVGIHGEAGRDRTPAASAGEIVGQLLDALIQELPGTPEVGGSGGLLLFTNGLGGLPPLELYAAHAHAAERLGADGHRVTRSLVGPLVTSLGMVGLSLTLLRLDDELLRHWDAPCRSAGWTVV
jgi:dihydroxyacetone kinase